MAEKAEDFDFDQISRDLVYVKKGVSGDNIAYGGWKRELLVEKIVSTSEERLLICTFCNGVLRDALVVSISQKKQPRCSVCYTGFHHQTEKADLIRSVIDERLVFCPLFLEGCEWEGGTINLLSHLKNCELLSIPCPLGCLVENHHKLTNPSSLIRTIPRKLLKSHLMNDCPKRTTPCNFCGERMGASEINSHLSYCEEFPIECPNECNFHSDMAYVTTRKKMNKHLMNDCPKRITPCNFCDQRMEANEINSHLSYCKEFPIECPNECHFHSVKQDWDSDTVDVAYVTTRKKMNEHLKNDCPLKKISCPYSKHGCKIVVFRKDVSIHSLQSTQVHLALVETTLMEVEEALKTEKEKNMKSNSDVKKLLGGIEWRVFGYKNKIRKNFDPRSPPFYSSGYKFHFYLTLFSQDTIGIYFEILAGDHDSQLPWPISCELTVKIVNKSKGNDLVKDFRTDFFRDQSSFNRPTPHKPNVPFGCELIPMDEIKSRGFSCDGTLLIRVFVKCV